MDYNGNYVKSKSSILSHQCLVQITTMQSGKVNTDTPTNILWGPQMCEIDMELDIDRILSGEVRVRVIGSIGQRGLGSGLELSFVTGDLLCSLDRRCQVTF